MIQMAHRNSGLNKWWIFPWQTVTAYQRILRSDKLTVCYWTWPIYNSFIKLKDGDCPVHYLKLAENQSFLSHHWTSLYNSPMKNIMEKHHEIPMNSQLSDERQCVPPHIPHTARVVAEAPGEVAKCGPSHPGSRALLNSCWFTYILIYLVGGGNLPLWKIVKWDNYSKYIEK